MLTVDQEAREHLKLLKEHSCAVLKVLMLEHERSKTKGVLEALAKVPERQATCDKPRVPARRPCEATV